MGWFGTDVFGGDTPMDELNTIEDVIGVENLYPVDAIEDKDKVADGLMRHKAVLLQELNNKKGWEQSIAIQVLAATFMAVGAPFPAGLRVRAINAAKNDEWGREDSERFADMNDFAVAVQNYDNKTPTVLNHEGLFQKIAKSFGG